MRLKSWVVLAALAVAATTGGRAAPPAAAASQTPQRIVSLVPAVTEMIFATGAGASVVGVSTYDKYPPEAALRPSVGALLDPDVERIFSLKPDLVIVYRTQDDLRTQLARAGVPVFVYSHGGLADVPATIRRLGQRIDRGPESERVALSIERELRLVQAEVGSRPRPRTLLLFGREAGSLRGLYASGGVGFMHDMIVAAGGDNLFADVAQENVQTSVETLLARRPDVIVETHASAGWTPERVTRELAVWAPLRTIPAVRSNRVHILADDRVSIPGPRIALAVRELARVLHPK